MKLSKQNVCIIVPYFNNQFIEKLLESLDKQTMSCDIILVNDGSNQIFYSIFHRNLTVLHHTNNKGVGSALNSGLNIALSKSYEFIGLVSSNAILPLNFIEESVSTLKNNTKLFGVCCKAGLANPSNISVIMYHLRIYKGFSFQLDASMWRVEAFSIGHFPNWRFCEDAIFCKYFKINTLKVLDLFYYHYEENTISDMIRTAYIIGKQRQVFNRPFLTSFVLTPYTMIKIICKKHWFHLAGFLPIWNIIILLSFLRGNHHDFLRMVKA